MSIGIMKIQLRIPGCSSLKEKRSHLKPLLHRIHKEFNVSIAELSLQDKWTETILLAAHVSNDPVHSQGELNNVYQFIQHHYPHMDVIEYSIEIL
jgi:uncharacterized protein